MAYVSMKELLLKAKENKCAVGAFNIVNYLTAQASVDAARELNAPIILQTSVKTVKQFGIKRMIEYLKPLAENAEVDVAIHLDHCTDPDYVKKCIDAGWTSVMIDASKHSLDKNIAMTKDVMDYAKGKGITVEGELGAIVGVEDDIVVNKDDASLANVDDCRRYLKETKVDAFAPAIGTAHGVYKGKPVINYELYGEIQKFSDVPLVLHGGTGLEKDVFINLISSGASKVNISTAVKIAYCQGMHDYTSKNSAQNDPLKLDDYVYNNVKAVVSEHIKLFMNAK